MKSLLRDLRISPYVVVAVETHADKLGVRGKIGFPLQSYIYSLTKEMRKKKQRSCVCVCAKIHLEENITLILTWPRLALVCRSGNQDENVFESLQKFGMHQSRKEIELQLPFCL